MNETRNRDLNSARDAKKDEFYTQLTDIEKELRHYKAHFKNKIVYCNCDDPRVSNFFHYFSHNFEKLGLKKLIATCYKGADIDLFSDGTAEQAIMLEYSGDKNGDRTPGIEEIGVTKLTGDGDFRSAESIEILKSCDIVVTNPPFSLFREYIGQLVKYEKKFLIIGNLNAVTYKDVFDLFQKNQVWFGPSIKSGDREFGVPDSYPLNAAGTRVDSDGRKYIRVKGVRWFTNMDFKERHEEMVLYKNYSEAEFPKYVNYDAIDVSKTNDIPNDYFGHIGVPITFLDKYNPEQFEILGSSRTLGTKISQIAEKGTYQQGGPRFYLSEGNGTYRRMYDRIVVRRRVK